jgi:hypothetical protein
MEDVMEDQGVDVECSNNPQIGCVVVSWLATELMMVVVMVVEGEEICSTPSLHKNSSKHFRQRFWSQWHCDG